MKCAVIDIGSNSMRLTVYDAEKTSFKILFREKVMAGLAGYVEKGRLTAEGIACACSGLLEFRETLEVLGIDGACVFATASLRNVTNTQQAVAEISAATGYDVEVLSGEDEAALGYLGAMCELNMTCGVLTDIGGASTEVTLFRDGAVVSADSFPIGSLKLYRECVKKILPGKKAMDRICAQVRIALKDVDFDAQLPGGQLVCVGGTARAVLKLARRQFGLLPEASSFTAAELERLWDVLSAGDHEGVELILRTEPERIHTLIPGLAILRYLAKRFRAEEIIVSKYGVREGYLCQRIQSGM